MKPILNLTALMLLFSLFSSCVNLNEANDTIKKLEEENKYLQDKLEDSRDVLSELNTQLEQARSVIAELSSLSNSKKLKSLSITDEAGEDRIKLYVDNDGVPRIRLYNENLNPTVSLFSYPVDSKNKGAAGLAVIDKNDKPVVWLGNQPNHSSYLLFSAKNRESNSIVLGNNFQSNASFLAMYDQNANLRYATELDHEADVTTSIMYSSNLSSNFQVSAFKDGRILRRMQDSNKMLRQANVIDGNNNLYEMHYDYQGNLKQALYIPTDNSKYQNYVYKRPVTQLWDWLSNIMTAKSLLNK